MRSLLNYIIEKLDINKVNLPDFSTFPYKGSVEDIKKFLIQCNFIETGNGGGSPYKRIKVFDDAHCLCYAIPGTVAGEALSFANTSKKKISEDNPMINVFKPYNRDILYEIGWDRNIKNIDASEFEEKVKEILKQ